MKDRNSRMRVGAVAGAFGAAVVATVGAASGAGATVTQMGMSPGISVGSATNYGTGCTYQARATVTDVIEPVVFYDNGVAFAVARPSGGVALVTWVPTTPGPHTISAVQAPDDTIVASLDLRVGTGMHLGYSCIVSGG
ncbi:hypothetical protein [Nocardia iowensis]|uniref:Ig-like domain-containing protein n=1 Tax=Nocardia iowensis TaxID=204891 RepID=A0ABX8RLD5_NOCIO|nr:hypothetical protein [Nocardia iowensis]QXN90141.1 hypothetical protein KV110_32665 [Nocardia iowensis]